MKIDYKIKKPSFRRSRREGGPAKRRPGESNADKPATISSQKAPAVWRPDLRHAGFWL
jgi:hypothetical protein